MKTVIRDDDEYIHASIETLEKQFDLVILTEYFLESMVLLADIMCIPYEVLWAERQKELDYYKEPLNERQMEIFKTFFKQDYMVYDHFNKTLYSKLIMLDRIQLAELISAKIASFGQEKMKYELMKLKAVYKKCSKDASKCKLDKGVPNQASKRKHQPMKVEDFLTLMENNYGTCPNPGNQYYKMKTGKLDPKCGKDQSMKRNFEFARP